MTAITIQGNMFFLGTERWSPKGLAYQPVDGADPLSDEHFATLEALVGPSGNFTRLNINALRVYQVDPNANHDRVMALLAQRGIYVLVGAVTTDTAIPRNASSLPPRTVARVKAVADAFARYDNVLGFNLANELLDSAAPSEYPLPGLVKQLASILRAHLRSQGARAIPLGAATRDTPAFTGLEVKAYACGDDRLDYVAYNNYRWADGDLTGRMDAYQQLYALFGDDFPIPAIFGEYGAMPRHRPRDWSQVPYLFGQKRLTANGANIDMSSTFSGGFAFRYQMDNEGLNLVDGSGQPIPGRGFDELAAAYRAITSFPGTPRHAPCDCSGDNPYAGGNKPSGGLPRAITLRITNEFSPPRDILVNYQLVGSQGWEQAAALSKGSAPVHAVLPAGTRTVQVVWHDEGANQWWSGCSIDATRLSDGGTLVGQWMAPDGKGTCQCRGP